PFPERNDRNVRAGVPAYDHRLIGVGHVLVGNTEAIPQMADRNLMLHRDLPDLYKKQTVPIPAIVPVGVTAGGVVGRNHCHMRCNEPVHTSSCPTLHSAVLGSW